MRGPLDFGSQNAQNLRIDVTSNPPLSQDEAFAKLLGTSRSEITGTDGEPGTNASASSAYASAFLSVLSAPLFAGIERSLEQALGLSSITLDYRLNEPLSVQFGKAVGDRVYVSYRRTLTGNLPGQPVSYQLRVDYRIKGDLQLGLQTDERGRRQITLDKTWRF
jgi:autotransporter translocation and assembly factor TamB